MRVKADNNYEALKILLKYSRNNENEYNKKVPVLAFLIK